MSSLISPRSTRQSEVPMEPRNGLVSFWEFMHEPGQVTQELPFIHRMLGKETKFLYGASIVLQLSVISTTSATALYIKDGATASGKTKTSYIVWLTFSAALLVCSAITTTILWRQRQKRRFYQKQLTSLQMRKYKEHVCQPPPEVLRQPHYNISNTVRHDRGPDVLASPSRTYRARNSRVTGEEHELTLIRSHMDATTAPRRFMSLARIRQELSRRTSIVDGAPTEADAQFDMTDLSDEPGPVITEPQAAYVVPTSFFTSALSMPAPASIPSTRTPSKISSSTSSLSHFTDSDDSSQQYNNYISAQLHGEDTITKSEHMKSSSPTLPFYIQEAMQKKAEPVQNDLTLESYGHSPILITDNLTAADISRRSSISSLITGRDRHDSHIDIGTQLDSIIAAARAEYIITNEQKQPQPQQFSTSRRHTYRSLSSPHYRHTRRTSLPAPTSTPKTTTPPSFGLTLIPPPPRKEYARMSSSPAKPLNLRGQLEGQCNSPTYSGPLLDRDEGKMISHRTCSGSVGVREGISMDSDLIVLSRRKSQSQIKSQMQAQQEEDKQEHKQQIQNKGQTQEEQQQRLSTASATSSNMFPPRVSSLMASSHMRGVTTNVGETHRFEGYEPYDGT